MTLLFPHQRAGAEWLARRRTGYLGDTPGTGKTRTLLAAAQRRDPTAPVLVLCPAIAREHWHREAAVLGMAHRVTVQSYDGFVRRAAPCGPETVLLLDEAHYLKTPTAQRTKQVLGPTGPARHAAAVYLASGTPIPRHPAELWPVLASCFPAIPAEHGFRRMQDMVDAWCATRPMRLRGKTLQKITGIKPEAEGPVRTMLASIMLRRTPDDLGLGLPPIWWQTLPLEASTPALAQLGAHPAWAEALAGGADLESLLRDEAVARYRRAVGELKAALIGPELADQARHEPVVVFAHHRRVLARLRAVLDVEEIPYVYVDGDTPPARRADAERRFQTDPAIRVFLGQQTACQVSLTLTKASRVLLLEPDWTAVNNVQAASRVARLGQTAGTCVAQMVSLPGTLDDAIVAQHLRQAAQFTLLMHPHADATPEMA
jgi:SNF2 family DNA or RNA helicase